MSLVFQSICSSSAGNCVTLCSGTTRLLIDCGLSSMKRTRRMLSSLQETRPVDALLLTHIHGDHISYYPLRVLEEAGVSVRLHDDCIAALKDKHFNGYGFGQLQLSPFGRKPFEIGDFRIHPFEVVHNPHYTTFGFDIRCGNQKAVIATDFCQWEDLVGHFIGADFIFVESNHDLALLRQYYNPNSRYHLPNPQTAKLLAAIVAESKTPPRAVMLGHMSSQRNRPELAIRQTRQDFERAGKIVPFELTAAPLKTVSEPVRI